MPLLDQVMWAEQQKEELLNCDNFIYFRQKISAISAIKSYTICGEKQKHKQNTQKKKTETKQTTKQKKTDQKYHPHISIARSKSKDLQAEHFLLQLSISSDSTQSSFNIK